MAECLVLFLDRVRNCCTLESGPNDRIQGKEGGRKKDKVLSETRVETGTSMSRRNVWHEEFSKLGDIACVPRFGEIWFNFQQKNLVEKSQETVPFRGTFYAPVLKGLDFSSGPNNRPPPKTVKDTEPPLPLYHLPLLLSPRTYVSTFHKSLKREKPVKKFHLSF